MKRFFYAISLLVLSIIEGWYSYSHLTGGWLLAGIFVSGVGVGMFLVFLKLNVKNDKINSYKRKLEKESVLSDENSAKVKVLEQKIQVLERALENSINKNS